MIKADAFVDVIKSDVPPKVVNHFNDHFKVWAICSLRECCEQKVVTQDIDESWNPATNLVDQCKAIVGKHTGIDIASTLKPMEEILPGLV